MGPARHGVLLLNPRSGGGKVARFGLAAKARALGVDAVELRPGDDLRRLAELAVASGADVLGMACGDGSQALRRRGPPAGLAFVCVPSAPATTSRSISAWTATTYPRRWQRSAMPPRRVDLAELNGQVFVNNVSLGVYATVAQSSAYRDAKAATVAHQLPDLLGPGRNARTCGSPLPDGTPQESADLMLVSNGPYRLERLSVFGARERLDSGTLGVATVTVHRAGEIPVLVSAEMTGRISRFSGYRSWSTPEFQVDSERPNRGGRGRRGDAVDAAAVFPDPARHAAGARTFAGVRRPVMRA